MCKLFRMIDGIFWVIKIAHLEGLRQSLLIPPLNEIVQVFFHLLDTGPLTPWGPNEKVITVCKKNQSTRLRQIYLQKETLEQSLSAFLLLAGMKAQKYLQMEHEYDVNILTSFCLHSRRTMKNLILRSVDHPVFNSS